jgi:hypothetical protein
MDMFRSMRVTAIELEEGFVFSFPASSGTLQGIAELVDMERRCCPFLTFKIVVEATQPKMRLEVTGPMEAKKVIGEYFGFQHTERVDE